MVINPRLRNWISLVDRMTTLLGMGKEKALPDQEKVRHVLLIELWGIGDVVLSTVGLQGLRIIYPNAKISLLAQQHGKTVLANCTEVDEFVVFKFPWTNMDRTKKYQLWKYPWGDLFKLIRRLRKSKIDLVVDARSDIRNNILLWLFGVTHRIAYSNNGGSGFLTRKIVQPPEVCHRVEQWRFLLDYLGHQGDPLNPRLCLSREELETAAQWKQTLGIGQNQRLIGIHPGAANPLRRWPKEKYLEVMLATDRAFENIQWLIFGEQGNLEADWLKHHYSKSVRVTGDLRTFLAVANLCDLMLVNDSGPMHMAATLNKPLIAIFGPQKPEWFGPWSKSAHVVKKDGIDCRGCYDQCIQERPVCMDIDPDSVITLVKQVLESLRVKD